MYVLLETPEYDPGARVLASFQDEFGGRARIINDDHCFVLQLWSPMRSVGAGGEGAHWTSVTHWFKEVADALHDMVFLYKTIDDVPGAKEQ